MALQKNDVNKVSARVFGCLSLVVGVVLLAVGDVCWKTGMNAESMVSKSLTAEKIYFPPADSPAMPAAAYPVAQKYAGMQVKDGATAKAFADNYLDVQSKLLSNGKTASEVGAMLAVDPQNPMLQQLQGAKFQLETNKAELLSAYGSFAQGTMVKQAGMYAVVAGAVLLVVSCVEYARYRMIK